MATSPSELENFSNSVIAITGASRGIGRETARLLAAEKSCLVLNCYQEAELISTQTKELLDLGARAVAWVVGDVSKSQTHSQIVQTAVKKFGYLDGYVNNAGILRDNFLRMITEEQLNGTMQVNFNSVIYGMQFASAAMRKRGRGSIVNVSSIMGLRGNAGQAVYAGSKAAVIASTKSVAYELAPLGIRVNAVSPGVISTDMTSNLTDNQKNLLLGQIALGKFGTAADVANMISFLLSDQSKYITGKVIGVDGGMIS